jgi:hypothetical protein
MLVIKEEIKKDKENIKHWKIWTIEKIRLEKYYMKKSEDIYIIEFENDTFKK